MHKGLSPLLHHAAHTAHAAHIWHSATSSGWFWLVSDNRFSGQEHSRYGCCVLQRITGYLGRVNDPCFEHVYPLIGSSVVADADSFFFRRSTITEPSWPALAAMVRTGSSSARSTRFTPVLSSPSATTAATAAYTFTRAVPHRIRYLLQPQRGLRSGHLRCGACALSVQFQ